MTIVLALAAALAGGVLLASGILKLGRTEAFHQSLEHLGVPAFLRRSRAFAQAFPFGEIVLGLATLLLPSPWQVLPLLAATTLFCVFFVVSIRASAAPEEVECECFGGLGDARMTRGTVVRNGVFLALAVAGLLAPASPASVSGELTGVPFIPLFVSALVIGVLVIRRNTSKKSTPGEAFRAPAPTPPAPATPDEEPLVLYTVDGEAIELAEYTTPPTHLVFFSADCSSCQELVERFRWWPHALREGDDLQPVFLGAKEDFADYEAFVPLLEHALYDPRRAVARRLGLKGTPGAVHLDAEHPLGRGWVAGAVAIEAVVVRPGFFEERDNGVRAAE